jgi:tRNA modification GTPase
MSDRDTLTDTIAAISTPPGRGGIGIVRLSGPESTSIAVQLVRLRQPLEHARARFADVLDTDSAPIDEAIVTYFAAPNSYTAEDLVEIAAHGSPVVLDLLLRRALLLGARLAAPGEFTQRAYLAGKLDLTQAEAVHDLIDAHTLTQARQAASQLGGALSRRVAPLKHSLVELIALLEAGIDFAEDDIDVTPAAEIARRIAELTPQLTALQASFARGRVVHDGLTLAIVGRPNAGKSSLFNHLVERDRAIVTATPGTTRDLVTERISIDGIPIELVDTAGLRDSHEEVEQLGIARSREALADAALVLIVLDATQPLNDEERSLFALVANRPALIVVNKSDLASPHLSTAASAAQTSASPSEAVQSEAAQSGSAQPGFAQSGSAQSGSAQSGSAQSGSAQLAMPLAFSISPCDADTVNVLQATNIPWLATSALTGSGIPALRAEILALATGGAANEPGLLTTLRHHQAVTTTLDALADAAAANAASIPHEMILIDLYRALWALDSLTGQTTPDDILNLIFSTFCIGK